MRHVGFLASRSFVIAALTIVMAASCSSSETPPQGEGGAGNGGAGTGGPSSWTCQQIRMCVYDCLSDQCVQACAAKGTADAQATFEALRACTAMACTAVTDVNCACAEQCLDGGSCFAEVEACLAGATADLICDSALCH
jgi:hypothetical protein